MVLRVNLIFVSPRTINLNFGVRWPVSALALRRPDAAVLSRHNLTRLRQVATDQSADRPAHSKQKIGCLRTHLSNISNEQCLLSDRKRFHQSERNPQRMDSRYYPGIEADVFKLVAELRSVFDQDFEVQTMHVSSTTVVQARKSSTLRDLTGLSAALTIRITPEAGGTRVEIGMQKWLDKAAIAAVAVLLSAGLLAAIPALGAYWQYKLTEDAWKIVEGHFSRRTRNANC
jgi:hypothetical protein